MKRVVLDEVTRKGSEGTICTADEGRCRQDLAAMADIHNLVQPLLDGVLAVEKPRVYADVASMPQHLHEALEQVRHAEAVFQEQPAKVRNAFENDVAKFTDAFQSKAGRDLLKELGVIARSEEELANEREAAIERRARQRQKEREYNERLEKAKEEPRPSSS